MREACRCPQGTAGLRQRRRYSAPAAERSRPLTAAHSPLLTTAGTSAAWRHALVPALVRRLRSGNEEQQTYAVVTLHRVLFLNSLEGRHAPVAAAVAAAIPELVQILRTSQSFDVLPQAAETLGALACDHSQRADAVVACGGVGALVERLSSDNEHMQEAASNALVSVIRSASSSDAVSEAAAAGAIPLAVKYLSSSSSSSNPEIARNCARLLTHLALDSPSRQQAIHSAGAIPALVRCLQPISGSDDEEQEAAVIALSFLAAESAERSQAIAEAGGAAAAVALLDRPCSTSTKNCAACVLCHLADQGQSQAFVATCPPDAVEAAVERQFQLAGGNVGTAVLNMAAARQAAQLELQVAAPMPDPAAQAAPPPRACSGPGCGTTHGRLNRCAGCGSVRYCSVACQAAHWPEHRRQCRRVRAQRVAAEAAGSSEAGPSQS